MRFDDIVFFRVDLGFYEATPESFPRANYLCCLQTIVLLKVIYSGAIVVIIRSIRVVIWQLLLLVGQFPTACHLTVVAGFRALFSSIKSCSILVAITKMSCGYPNKCQRIRDG